MAESGFEEVRDRHDEVYQSEKNMFRIRNRPPGPSEWKL